MNVIQVENAVKRYKNGVQALSGCSLYVKSGEIFSLLGQNGAGKSTLIRILTTYLRPTSGTITVLGKDICKEAVKIRSQIACAAQQTSIDTYLSLEENMLFQSQLYKIPETEAKKRMEQLIADFGLNQYKKYPVSSYSGGVKRRLDIALTMMSNPKLLFLDEPTVGLDLQSRIAMWNMLKKIRDDFGTTIFLTTHYLEEADHLSNTICIMKDGKDVIQGSPLKLRSFLRQNTLQIQFRSDREAKTYLSSLQEHFPQKAICTKNTAVTMITDESRVDMEQVIRFLLEQHIPFYGIEIAQPTLEDVFLWMNNFSESQ